MVETGYVRTLRIRNVLIIFFVFVLLVVTRLLYLQVHQANLLRMLGEKNSLRTEIIPPLRGNLYDCNRVLLAANRPVFDLCWQGNGSPILTENHLHLLDGLATLLKIDLQEKLTAIKWAERYSRRIMLKRDIGFEPLCQISEQCAGFQHLIIENRFERIYPYGSLASHVLGYLSRVEQIGKDGIEKFFQEHLRGQSGYAKTVYSATGARIRPAEHQAAQPGNDLVLTLDATFQRLAEMLLAPYLSGAFILIDPENGAIKALASHPSFDPNIFLTHISEDEWNNKFANNTPLLNRATCALYPPASTFKIVTMTAGLEEGIFNQNTNFICRGYSTFCDRKYHCQRKIGHGVLNPREALAASCNIPCFEIAKRLSIDTFALYAMRFGLGKKTNFLLPEGAGLMPTSMWKKIYKKESWWAGETLSASIGQSYLLATPLQLVRMISSVCTGYLVKPRILEHETIEKEPLYIAPQTLAFLQDSMHLAVEQGTVRRLKYLKNFSIYAKTGTAQTCSLSMEKTDISHYENGWLTCFFRYKNERPLAIIVILEHVGSSGPAVQFTEQYLKAYQQIRIEQETNSSRPGHRQDYAEHITPEDSSVDEQTT